MEFDMKNKVLIFISCFFLASSYAQETRVFTVDEAVDYALKNSRTLKSADIDLAIKERAAKYAWNSFLPNVQVTGTLSRQNKVDLNSANQSIKMGNMMGQMASAMGLGPYNPTPEVKKTEGMHWAGVGNVSVGVNLSLAQFEKIRSAKADYEGGKITLEQSRLDTKISVKKLFYGLLLQQENLKLEKASLENARRRNNQAKANWENGLVPELSYLQAYVAYENQKPSIAEAQRLLNQQLDSFAFLLGLPVGTKISLSGSVEPNFIDVDAQELISRYSSGSLDVMSLSARKNYMEHNLKSLNFSLAPALSVNWGYQPVISDPFNKSWGNSDNWTDKGSFSATLAWNLTNLLPCSSTRLQAQDLKDNIKKIDVSMDTVIENQKMEVRKAVNTINTAREQIDAMSRSISLAQRSYDTMEKAFEAGATELLDLRDAESQLNKAKFGLLNQKFNYISAVLDLEKILNIDLGVMQ